MSDLRDTIQQDIRKSNSEAYKFLSLIAISLVLAAAAYWVYSNYGVDGFTRPLELLTLAEQAVLGTALCGLFYVILQLMNASIEVRLPLTTAALIAFFITFISMNDVV